MTPKSKQQANAAKAREAYRNKIKEEAYREQANYIDEMIDSLNKGAEVLGPDKIFAIRSTLRTLRTALEIFMAERGIRPREEASE